jgi:hypothetical protein
VQSKHEIWCRPTGPTPLASLPLASLSFRCIIYEKNHRPRPSLRSGEDCPLPSRWPPSVRIDNGGQRQNPPATAHELHSSPFPSPHAPFFFIGYINLMALIGHRRSAANNGGQRRRLAAAARELHSSVSLSPPAPFFIGYINLMAVIDRHRSA